MASQENDKSSKQKNENYTQTYYCLAAHQASDLELCRSLLLWFADS